VFWVDLNLWQTKLRKPESKTQQSLKQGVSVMLTIIIILSNFECEESMNAWFESRLM
jgi:hypothetical protein